MTEIPPDHPRYRSLMTRERIVQGMRDGIVAEAGLIAHGRGEALDYLMGERTLPEALLAEKVAAVILKRGMNSVISVNGNTAVLAAAEIVELSELTGSRIEVNLFHRTEERISRISRLLMDAGAGEVLGARPDTRIPGLDSERGKCTMEGIGKADVILVPLEDGDRALALKEMGKMVICIDLNPLSRTSRTSDISIADELTRALKNMIGFLKEVGEKAGEENEEREEAGEEKKEKEETGEEKEEEEYTKAERADRGSVIPQETVDGFDNKKNIDLILKRIAKRLNEWINE